MVHRADKSKYFLRIEPESAKPVDDALTASLQAAMELPIQSTSVADNPSDKGVTFNAGNGYRGIHFAADGQVYAKAKSATTNIKGGFMKLLDRKSRPLAIWLGIEVDAVF